MRLPAWCAGLALVLSSTVASPQSPGEIRDRISTFASLPLEDTEKGELHGAAKEGFDYLARLLASDAALARCLPMRHREVFAAFRALQQPARRWKSSDADAVLREALIEEGKCRIRDDDFLAWLILTSEKRRGTQFGANAAMLVASYVDQFAQADARYAACSKRDRWHESLLLAARAQLATQGVFAPKQVADTYSEVVARSAVERVCAAPQPLRTYLRHSGIRLDDLKNTPERCWSAPGPDPTPTVRKYPVFPRSAVRWGIRAGSVLVHATVASGGDVQAITIVSDDPPALRGVFDEQLVKTLLEWRFAPRDCAFIAEFPIDFKLPE